MTALSELRKAVAEASEKLEQSQTELEESKERVGASAIDELERRYRQIRSQLKQALIKSSILAIAVAGGYWAWRWSNVPDGRADYLRQKAEEARSQARVHGYLENEGRSPPIPAAWLTASPSPASDRALYPALEKYRTALPDRQKADAILRWVNVGVAACTVGEVDLARWAMNTIRSTESDRESDLDPNRKPNDVDRAVATIAMRCGARGHNVLTFPGAVPTESH